MERFCVDVDIVVGQVRVLGEGCFLDLIVQLALLI